MLYREYISPVCIVMLLKILSNMYQVNVFVLFSILKRSLHKKNSF